jgi:hypothetical protein
MSLHIDVPTAAEIEALLRASHPACVSIYMPTTPGTEDAEAERLTFKNAVSAVMEEVAGIELERGAAEQLEEPLDALHDDDEFWNHLSYSLAVFATPNGLRTYRLPNRLEASAGVSDRFFVKPLFRSVTFPQAAFVLALAQGSVRLLEISASAAPNEVAVRDMPTDVASAAGKSSIADRRPSRALQGSEGQKVRMRQYARKIDHALRSVLTGRVRPLILAATQPMDGIYRAVNTYPHLAAEGLRGNPEAVSDSDLADEARSVLDGIYAADLAALRDRYEARSAQGRGATEIGDLARAATFGAIDTVIVDIDARIAGTIDDETGAVTLDEDGGPDRPDEYGVVDEIARRAFLTGGRVVAVRGDDVPGGGPAAAILRFPV